MARTNDKNSPYNATIVPLPSGTLDLVQFLLQLLLCQGSFIAKSIIFCARMSYILSKVSQKRTCLGRPHGSIGDAPPKSSSAQVPKDVETTLAVSNGKRVLSVHHSQTSSGFGSARSSDNTTPCILSVVRGSCWIASWGSLYEFLKGTVKSSRQSRVWCLGH